MTRVKFKSIVSFLLVGLVFFQTFGGVVLDVTAQETTPTIPKPPYIEPEPVRQDLKSGGQILQGDSLDASSESTLILISGEAKIHGLIYYDSFLWASTRTSPAKIIKINPASDPMSVVNTVNLAENRNDAEDIVAANGYIWTVASETDESNYTGLTYLVRVDPATLAVQYTLLVEDAQNFLALGESLEYAHGKLWAGGYNIIAEIDITNPGSITFDLHDYSALRNQDYVWATALTSDATHLWAIFGQGDFTPPSLTGSTIARIDPANPASYVSTDISEIFPDDMFYTNSHLYTSSEVTGQPSTAYKIPNTLTPYTTQLAYNDGISYGLFFNPLDPYSFWGAYTSSPGKLIKFDLDMTQLWSFDLPTTPSNFDNPSEIVFDESGNMYVSTFTDPARLVKYTAPDAVTVSISKSGNDAVLSWTNSDTFVDHFEIWRSTSPYFTPQGTTPYATVTASEGSNIYTDVGALGDVNNNYFYVVRAFNDFGLLSPISNRVGEYDYALHSSTNLVKNDIAVVLSVSGVTDAMSLASYLGSFVKRVSRFNPVTQLYQTYTVGLPFTDFDIFPGNFLYLVTDNTAPATISLVGGVPDLGSISFALTLGSPAKRNFISMPLERNDLTRASHVAADIGSGVSRIYQFINSTQTYQTYTPGLPFTDFDLKIGEPFGASLTTGAPATWP